jgi:hypothetical protein
MNLKNLYIAKTHALVIKMTMRGIFSQELFRVSLKFLACVILDMVSPAEIGKKSDLEKAEPL